MFNWKPKATNAIYLKEDNGGKGRPFESRFLEAGLVKYSFGVCLLTKETIDKFVNSFVGCPVIIDHQDITDENAKDERVGVISEVWYNEKDGWFWCKGIIFDDEAIDLIKKGYTVSCQYEITEYQDNTENKLHNGNEFDKYILNGQGEHLAIVKNPRYENAIIAVNKADELKAENEDKWITIKPHGDESDDYRRLKLEDGETPKEAIERTFGEKETEKGTREKSLLDIIKEKEDRVKEFKEKKVLKDLKINKPFEEQQKEDLKTGELVDLAEDYYQRVDKETFEKDFAKIQGEFKKWIHKKNFPAYQNYRNLLLKLKKIYDERFKNKGNQAQNNIKGQEMFNFKKENNMDEIKEMLNSLLVAYKAKNEADKEDDKKEDDKKAMNENVDKRKLIDEIGGILKGKVDDELWRTIIGKAEKIAYDKSEAGTADNKCKNKCKNEDDEAGYEDLKGDTKESAENKKAKNSIEEMFYNGDIKTESNYISQKKAIELGKELF